MNKPFNIVVRDTKINITSILIESKLPVSAMVMIIEKTLSELKTAEAEIINKEYQAYHEELNKQNDNNEKDSEEV